MFILIHRATTWNTVVYWWRLLSRMLSLSSQALKKVPGMLCNKHDMTRMKSSLDTLWLLWANKTSLPLLYFNKIMYCCKSSFRFYHTVKTEELSKGAIAGIGVGFGLVIIMCCIFSLNCKCRPFWKKREVDETDVYAAASKVFSTTSNVSSQDILL